MATKSFHGSTFCRTLAAAGIAVSLGAGVGACTDSSMSQSHGIGAAVTDSAITARVKSGFASDARLKDSNITVATTNGVVTLSGWVSDPDVMSAAATVAGAVDGVKSVNDALRVSPPSGADATKMD